jgi:hypothetical protein
MIWIGGGLIAVAVILIIAAVAGAMIYPKYTRLAGDAVTFSAAGYAELLGAFRAVFFGIFPGIALLSGTVAWIIFKNLKKITCDADKAT